MACLGGAAFTIPVFPRAPPAPSLVRLEARPTWNNLEMSTTKLLSIVLLVAGGVLLVWGLNASDSFASEVSEAFDGSPTDKSIWLTAGGGVLAAIGLVGLLRRP